VDTVLPVFLLAGGEIFLGLVAARIAVWVVRGWRDYRRAGASPPPHPRGPGGGLRVLAGGASSGAGGSGGLREAA
jgi:hypothetical protein